MASVAKYEDDCKKNTLQKQRWYLRLGEKAAIRRLRMGDIVVGGHQPARFIQGRLIWVGGCMRKYKLQLICMYRHNLFGLVISIPVVLSKQGCQHTHPCKEEVIYRVSHSASAASGPPPSSIGLMTIL